MLFLISLWIGLSVSRLKNELKLEDDSSISWLVDELKYHAKTSGILIGTETTEECKS